ncbi:hypothetical protein MRX96_039903 [Rhipicephalus microplus]
MGSCDTRNITRHGTQPPISPNPRTAAAAFTATEERVVSGHRTEIGHPRDAIERFFFCVSLLRVERICCVGGTWRGS